MIDWLMALLGYFRLSDEETSAEQKIADLKEQIEEREGKLFGLVSQIVEWKAHAGILKDSLAKAKAAEYELKAELIRLAGVA